MTRDQMAPRGTAKDRALRLLGVRWRSRKELERRLRQAGFEPDDIAAAIGELERAGLVDDARFAQAVVADRAGRRLSGDRAIRTALFQKGVAADVADAALLDAGDEADRALELARKRAGRMVGMDPAVAARRLHALLLRRGFAPGIARDACRAALGEALAETPGADVELTQD
jgi:regulatory protein